MRTLNVLGCGAVGRTLARRWTQDGAAELLAVLNRSLASGRRAVAFIGCGRAVRSPAQLPPADLMMISAADEAIETCCRRLCAAGVLRPGTVVFHCSGALGSTILEPAHAQGAWIASLHPVKSFADPALAAKTFAGTYCTLEGDPQACEVLDQACRQSGGLVFRIDPALKTIYHAGTVFACNYLVTLVEIGLRCLERAGVDRETAAAMLRPLVAGAGENALSLGPVRALTGPIARGEASVVARQCEALGQWDPSLQRLYKVLGTWALELSAAKGSADPAALAAIEKIFKG
ncbi:MAG: Rossmann-like and DUF2520 domain-containing protein [Thermoguttaceae bacterium]